MRGVLGSLILAISGSAAFGGSLSILPTAPETNIISSSPAGGIDTALFDEDANANHARGQLFSLPNGSGSAFEISSITLKKSTTQTYAGDLITLRIFEGTQAQWDAGTGHSSAIDGEDFFQGTEVNLIHTETFLVSGTFQDNQYISLVLDNPVVVPEASNLGFILTYDQASASNPDRFRHRENGSGGGRISITTSNHGTSGSRRMVYFIQGSEVGAAEQLELAPPFQNGMVLQRGKPIKIWGIAEAESMVSLQFDGEDRSTLSDSEGKWSVEFPPMTAGGPFQLHASSGQTSIQLDDILIGDVWLAFGQSNMVRPLNEMTGKEFYIDEIENNEAPIRCLKVTQFGAFTPQEHPVIPTGHYVTGAMNWLDASTSESWTSVGTVFAYRMYEATNVPTAIIWAAWGSSSIEGWMPAELDEKLPHFAELLPDFFQVGQVGSVSSYATTNGFATNTDALQPLLSNGWTGATNSRDIFVRTRPNLLYNQMIHPLLDLGISGFVWYQGEANSSSIDSVAAYGFSLPVFVQELRSRFNQGDLPFLGVQLPSFNNPNWPWFREAQTQLEKLPNAHLAISIDTGLTNNIHPPDKEPIGIRLALLAREHGLGEAIEGDSPRFSEVSFEGAEATISLVNASGLQTDDSLPPASFEIAGVDRVFHSDTTTVIEGNTVKVSSPSEPDPVAIRYAWSATPMSEVNLMNSAGLPAAPFRTDSWPLPGLAPAAPASIPDSYETERDQTLIVIPNGVLTNDIDLNRDELVAELVSGADFGTVDLLPDGSFTYTPEEGFAGTDSFSYRCSDGDLMSEATTVSIQVTGSPTSFYLWKSGIQWAQGDDDSRLGDPDSDGVSNFIEFALGMDPLLPDVAGLPSLVPNKSGLLYQFNPARSDLVYEVQVSPDLVNWMEPPIATITSPSETPVAIPSTFESDGSLFVRLRIREP